MHSYFLAKGVKILSLSVLAVGANAALAHRAADTGTPQIEHVLAAIKDKLALDTSQQLLWDRAYAQSLAAREAARSGRSRLHDALQVELTKNDPDLARIAALADDVQATAQAARRQARDQWLTLYATFAPDQKIAARDLIKKRTERRARFAEHRRERSEQRRFGQRD